MYLQLSAELIFNNFTRFCYWVEINISDFVAFVSSVVTTLEHNSPFSNRTTVINSQTTYV